jgi:hypothetical protein
MNHPLEGSRLKVVRAEKHLQAFKHELWEHLDTKHERFIRQREGTGVRIVTAPPADLPSELSLPIGDCAVNLMSALDYIVWQLAQSYWACAPERGKDKIYYLRPDSFTNDGRSKSVPATALALLKRAQPKNAGYELLGILRDLVNEDKHRLPLLTYATTSSITDLQVEFPGGVFRSNIVAGSLTLATADPSQPPINPENVKVDGDATVFVTLKNVAAPDPVDRLLENLVKCVAGIVGDFEKVFT